MKFVELPKVQPGDRVAILSPSFAAPGIAPEVHEQALRRLAEVFDVVPVEYPTTRLVGASAESRAADLHAAFADPSIKAILATIGGDDQITVTRYLDPEILKANPKPFIGYSDNTNLHNYLWRLGIPSYYGGSTQVHIGSGPAIDEIHLESLRAALSGGEIELYEPGESEDFGVNWVEPTALTTFGEREPTEPWVWAGPERVIEGRTWGGCVSVLDQLAIANQYPALDDLAGTVLLLESAENLPSADEVMRIVRALGERGLLAKVAGVLVARPPTSELFSPRPTAQERAELRAAQRDVVIEQVKRYNPEAVVCVGVPFGHTRPQWIVPYGGTVRLDGLNQTVTAAY